MMRGGTSDGVPLRRQCAPARSRCSGTDGIGSDRDGSDQADPYQHEDDGARIGRGLHHVHLLHQFLSPLANRRQDDYGGTLENRMRLALEIADAVKAALPAEVALGFRITGTDWAGSRHGWDRA
ncbi:hypothetical protein DLM46_35080 [Paraburkholderia lacunae]|uniref:NADH:flavin oxidoreductase/NADH oxidase N-terminal domain-containing protein n=1 Tax=Paraburkholderia lacunae TaxID=2211104 RepID=A0A370MXL8_9BURK|nr:hypothetical protein DLM46_35080 [Paraburkholderia lacunae]